MILGAGFYADHFCAACGGLLIDSHHSSSEAECYAVIEGLTDHCGKHHPPVRFPLRTRLRARLARRLMLYVQRIAPRVEFSK